MRAAMRATIMICKTMIWYFLTWWNKTEKDYPAYIYLGTGRPGRCWQCLNKHNTKTLRIWYVTSRTTLSELRTFTMITSFTATMLPT